jgi:hypothetical protein
METVGNAPETHLLAQTLRLASLGRVESIGRERRSKRKRPRQNGRLVVSPVPAALLSDVTGPLAGSRVGGRKRHDGLGPARLVFSRQRLSDVTGPFTERRSQKTTRPRGSEIPRASPRSLTIRSSTRAASPREPAREWARWVRLGNALPRGRMVARAAPRETARWVRLGNPVSGLARKNPATSLSPGS